MAGLYSRLIFPQLCELALRSPFVSEHRRKLLTGAGGEVLEIGLGTGLNLPHYPPQVRRITAIDPNLGMHRKAARRIEQSEIEVDERLAESERLPFDEATFDCVVSTFTLCSVRDVQQTMSEIFRVLKPGGSFLFLEHGLSPDAKIQRWQRRLNGLQRRLADNCHLDRQIASLVSAQPFTSVEATESYLERTPRTHGYIYHGAAKK